ncbi:MAG: LuxR C-terminal-related transcriptional regulator [Myxococcales bacterium]
MRSRRGSWKCCSCSPTACPTRRIADRLGVSEHTAKFHVNAILAKLGAQSRTEAVVRGTRLGLVVL